MSKRRDLLTRYAELASNVPLVLSKVSALDHLDDMF